MSLQIQFMKNNYTLKHENSIRIIYVCHKASEKRDSPNHWGDNFGKDALISAELMKQQSVQV